MHNIFNEVWKDIPNYEGFYQASNLGRIKSLDKNYGNRFIKGRIKKFTKNSSGYYLTNISKDQVTKTVSVHRLVAMAFVPNPNQYKEVNHIDGDKENNTPENLEWCTRSENITHSYALGLKVGCSTGKFGKNHHLSTPITVYNRNKIKIFSFESTSEAGSNLNIRQSTISLYARNKKLYKGEYYFTSDKPVYIKKIKIKKDKKEVKRMFNEKQILDILNSTNIPATVLGKKYTCSHKTILAIKNRKIYKDIIFNQ